MPVSTAIPTTIQFLVTMPFLVVFGLMTWYAYDVASGKDRERAINRTMARYNARWWTMMKGGK